MSCENSNIVPFPLDRRRRIRGCPQCGAHSDVWRIGRLLWGYCERHELRWVVADYKTAAHGVVDRQLLRRGLEFLANYVEVGAG